MRTLHPSEINMVSGGYEKDDVIAVAILFTLFTASCIYTIVTTGEENEGWFSTATIKRIGAGLLALPCGLMTYTAIKEVMYWKHRT